MMKSADPWQFDNIAELGWLNLSGLGSILAQRQMRSRAAVIIEVARENAANMLLIHGDDMVEALSPDWAHEALDARVLPR